MPHKPTRAPPRPGRLFRRRVTEKSQPLYRICNLVRALLNLRHPFAPGNLR
jgi:hypothetical protein